MIGRLGLATAVAAAVIAGTGGIDRTAAAAGCTWTGRVLVMPAGMVSAQVTGTDGAYRFSGVASGTDGVRHPVVWQGDRPTVLSTAAGEATDVNRDGVVVGWLVGPGGEPHGFTWRAGTLTPLAAGGGATSQPAAIIGDGRIAGSGFDAQRGYSRGLRWSAATPGQVQVTPGPLQDLEFYGLSGTGLAVGSADEPGAPLEDLEHAVTVGPAGLAWLPEPTETFGSVAYAAAGPYVVGLAFRHVRASGAVVWTNGSVRVLAGDEYSSPSAVNAAGVVAGSGFLSALVWPSPTAAPIALPPLPGSGSATATAVTDTGRVAGWSQPGTGRYRPTLWTCG